MVCWETMRSRGVQMWHLSWNAVVACRWSFPGMRLYERLLFKSQCTCALLHHSYILRDRCVGKSPERKKGRTDSKNKQTLAFLSSYFFKLLHLYVAVFSGKPFFLSPSLLLSSHCWGVFPWGICGWNLSFRATLSSLFIWSYFLFDLHGSVQPFFYVISFFPRRTLTGY